VPSPFAKVINGAIDTTTGATNIRR